MWCWRMRCRRCRERDTRADHRAGGCAVSGGWKCGDVTPNKIPRAGIANLTFRDSRAEAIWRLSKKLDVMELARMIGHRDLKSLLIYYQTTAAELADRLG